MKIVNKEVTIETKEYQTFIDITEIVRSIVRDSEVRNGFVQVYTTHTTSGFRIIENEELLKLDIKNFFERTAPKDGVYYHNDIQKREVPSNERLNAHSHIRSLLINTSEYVPIMEGVLYLGEWQRIIFLECDSGRKRTYLITVFGE